MNIPEKAKAAFPYILLLAYGLFSCGYFFLDDYASHYRLYARFVFFLGLFAFPALSVAAQHPVFPLLCIYMLYLLASGLWSDPLDWFRLGQKATISVYLLNFIAVTCYLVRWNRPLFRRVLKLCVAVAAVAAGLSMIAFYRDNPFPATRLEGLGSLTNVNEFAVVYGVFALLALHFMRDASGPLRKASYLAAIGLFLAFAIFGQSRTTLLALLVAMALMLTLSLREHRAWLGAAIVATVALLLALFPESLQQAIERGAGLRPGIWAGVWAEIRTAPLFGHGLVSPLAVSAGNQDFHNAHSAYLQVLWEGGAVGLALFLALLLASLRHAWALGQRADGGFLVFCLLVFAALTMTTDLATLIERPRDQWMLFWFPLALLLSAPGSGSHQAAGRAPAAST